MKQMRGAVVGKEDVMRWLVLLLLAGPVQAAVYQWAIDVTTTNSGETGKPPKAYLWIPPDCGRVRAVIVGQHNMEEEPILEHPAMRRTLARLGMAAVWVTPALDGRFDFTQGAGAQFDAMLARLAEVSGYTELRTAPIVPIGHSAMASYPWNFAAWAPERTLCALSVSGQVPYARDSGPTYGSDALDGVPGLVCFGEYEWAEERSSWVLDVRTNHPGLPISMLAEPGGGHFDMSERKVVFLAAYLAKVAALRLPAKPGASLRPIDPRTTGWRIDRWHRNTGPDAPAAPVGAYTGDVNRAIWCLDAEHARATEVFQAHQRALKPHLAGFIQEGKIVDQTPGTHQQVNLAFRPEGDDLTFKLVGTLIDTVPAGRPERWTGKHAGDAIEHARTGAVVIHKITGPVQRVGPDTWALRFDRIGFDNPRRSNDIWFFAEHPGDAAYRRCVQQAQMRFPLVNTAGAAQAIDFPAIPDQAQGVRRVPLQASSSAGLPVRFYVESGPAEIVGDALQVAAIPPRAKRPLTITVVAWQWGRAAEPRIQSAAPVRREFRLGAAASPAK